MLLAAGATTRLSGPVPSFYGGYYDGNYNAAVHEGALHVLGESVLYRMEGDAPVSVLAFPDSRPGVLHADPELGLLIGGRSVISLQDGVVFDHGPRADWSAEFGWILQDGFGGWVAYDIDSDRLLHYLDGSWAVLDPPGDVRWSTNALRRQDGSFLMWRGDEAQVMAPVATW